MVYLNSEGDKINYSGTITWLLAVTRGTVQLYSVAMFRSIHANFELSMFLVCPTIEINICSIPLIIVKDTAQNAITRSTLVGLGSLNNI